MGGEGGPQRGEAHPSGPRYESSWEDSSGYRDWRSAHKALGDGDRARTYSPDTCPRCRHIKAAIDEEALTEAEAAQRLTEEGLG